jgi:cation:H+ antiporter
VLGISSLIVAINLKKEIYRRDSLFLFGVSVLFFIFSLDGTIQRGEGLLLLCVFLLYVYFLIKYRPALDEKKFEKLLGHFYKPHKIHTLQTYEQALKKGLNYVTYKKLIGLGIDVKTAYREKLMLDIGKHVALGTFGMVVIYFGAKYLISSTLEISSLIHVPEEVLAVSLIAFGTSLPELSVSFVALKKGFGNILMGNIVGSCLANILLVGGISASLAAMDISSFDIVIAIPIMVLMVVFFIRYLQLEWLSRVMQGVTLLFLYGVFILSLALYYFL